MTWEVGNQKSRKKFKDVNSDILKLEGHLDEKEAKIWLYKFLRENPTFACQMLSGVELFPFQHMAIKAMMETDYFLGIWSRGFSKTYTTGVFAFLDAIMNQGVTIGIISKTFRQCAHPDTLIFCKRGLIKLSEVAVGDEVCSIRGWNKILNKWKNDKDLGFSIETKNGYELKGKFGHRLLKLDEEKMRVAWSDIENIKIGDYVPIHINASVFPCEDDYKDIDEAYFHGLVVGDGCFSKSYGYVNITSGDQETENFLKDFGTQRGMNLIAIQKKGCKQLRFNNKNFVNSFFINDSVKAENKSLCAKVLTATRENTKHFLAGLFDADGCVQKDRIELASSSKELVKQVQCLLLRFGIKSKIQKEKARGEIEIMGNKCLGRESYKLRITGNQNIYTFGKEIGFRLSRKRKLLINNENFKKCHDVIPAIGSFLKKKYRFHKTIKDNLTRENLSNILAEYSSRWDKKDVEIVEQLLSMPVIWQKITAVSQCQSVESVDIEVDNEHCYVGNGFINHNSRMIFTKIEDIAKNPKAAFLAQCITDTRKSNDQWVMEIGRSKIIALPLGDGEKLRGFRFQRMIIDELLLMPEKILNEVIIPFLSIVENPMERQKIYDLENQLIAEGKMTEEDRIQWQNNKIIGLSSASYKFEHLYKMYETYEHLIRNPDSVIESAIAGEAPKKNNAHRVIMHFSYDLAPTQLYDQNLLNQAKATLSQSQFDREFRSIFTDDSDGYFKVKKMKDCTIPDGSNGQSVEIIGDQKAEYILSFDPSWSESASSDNFAMHVIKLNKGTRYGTVVHTYAIAGTNLKKHIFYFHYLLTHFNIVAMVGDYNGAVQFISSCNESQLFKDSKIEIKCIDVDFDDPVKYEEDLKEAKKQYNKEDQRIAILRKPGGPWIRKANEMLQAAFDHKKILFAASAMDNDFETQQKADIPIDEITFSKDMDNSGYAKKIDFIEHIKELIDGIRVECALIEVTTSPQGNQSFDLPINLKKQSGENRPRKDSYSALVLGNWMMNVYYDMIAANITPVNSTFTPTIIK